MHSHCERARELFQSGQPNAAIELLNTDNSEDSLALLREYYLGEGLKQEALPIIKKLAEHDSAEGLVSQSIISFLSPSLPQAIDLAKKAIEVDPKLASAYNHLGRAYQNDGQAVKASKAFKAALKINPKYAQGYHNLALTRRAIGAMGEAISLYKKAIECEPKYESAWLNLGLSYATIEQHQDALEAFETLLEINKSHEQAMLNAGLVCHTLANFQGAIDYYDRCIASNANFAQAYSYKGILLNELQQTDDSLAQLKQAIELDPQDIDAWCELANVYEKLNDLESAEQANKQALMINPGHPIALIDAARIAKRNKDIDAALNFISRVNIQQLPYRSALEFSFEQGDIFDKAGQYASAYKAYQQANTLAAQSPRYQQIDQEALSTKLNSLSKGLAEQTIPVVKKEGFFARLFKSKKPEIETPNTELGSNICFLIGFPRSGTTLLDTMISASTSVVAIEEKPTIEKVLAQLKEDGLDYWDAQTRENIDWAKLREQYFQIIAEFIDASSAELNNKVIIDKLPFRFLDAFFIKQLFPQAKFLFVQRQPADVVLSNFMQNFVPNEIFVHFHSLESSVDVYDKSMKLWYSIKPHIEQNLLQISYESLIQDGEKTLQSITNFLSIEYSSAMLDTKSRLATRQRISTNSYAQVSQDLYTASLSRWQNYEEEFAPYLSKLKTHQENLGY